MMFDLRPIIVAVDLWLPVYANAVAGDPANNPYLQYGLLGLIIVGILYLKVIVPGWVYQQEIIRNKVLSDQIAKDRLAHEERMAKLTERAEARLAEKDQEIARLRDLAENRTIPLLERAMALVERVETMPWEGQQQHGSPSSFGRG